MATVQLSDGTVVQVSPEDLAWVSRFRWRRRVRQDGRVSILACINLRDASGRAFQKNMYLGRMLLGLIDPTLHVDHINGDTLDNRRENLRLATAQQNTCNRGPQRSNTSGYVGVATVRRGRYRAYVRERGKLVHLGYFSDPIEAAKARDRRASEVYGEFARLNFPLGESA